MSEHDTLQARVCEPSSVPSASEEAHKQRQRGRIPRLAWPYVLGLYDKGRETLKNIGERFGVEPSAVHYVLKQARLQNLQPTLEMPESITAVPLVQQRPVGGSSAGLNRPRQPQAFPVMVIAGGAGASSLPAAAPPPVVDEAVEQVSKSPLAKRVFDASAAVINAILAFERDPSRDNNAKLDDARKAGSRALAAVEIWTHQMTAMQTPSPSTARAAPPSLIPLQGSPASLPVSPPAPTPAPARAESALSPPPTHTAPEPALEHIN